MQEKEALMHCNPTRRTFLKGTAATAALAAVGTLSLIHISEPTRP